MKHFSTHPSPDRAIALWLFVCCGMVFLMVVIGGLTRLTGSGLSMVEWAPIMGWIPPLSETQWLDAFSKYKTSPEFRLINWDMDLTGFKEIFWLEYIHRLIGRLIGLVFLIPFLVFLVMKRIRQDMVWSFIIMFVLGGGQGLLGWLMVKSGLIHEPHVSQYRLTAHLGAAFIIYAYMLWVGFTLYFERTTQPAFGQLQTSSWLMTGMLFLTILSGGFVAGLKAGFAYNTFPLMAGRLFPEDYFLLEPAWLNVFENVPAVQWNHRLLALTQVVIIPLFWFMARRFELPQRVRTGLNLLLGMVLIQILLGISTLLWFVPIPLASAHQAGAMILFTFALFVNHQLRHPGPPEV